MKDKNNSLLTILILSFIIFAFGIAGASDYDDQVILHMPTDTYNEIYGHLSDSLGTAPTNHQIVATYKLRHK